MTVFGHGAQAIVKEDFRSLIQAEVPRQLQQLGWEVAIRCLGESNEPQMRVQPLLSSFRVGMDMMQNVLLHVASFVGAKSDIGHQARGGLEVLPPKHIECAIAWAGGATTYLQMPCTSTVGQVVRAFVGDHQQEVREVRHDGKWVSLNEPGAFHTWCASMPCTRAGWWCAKEASGRPSESADCTGFVGRWMPDKAHQ